MTKADAEEITLEKPEGDGERIYKPVRGRRRPLLMFVPNHRQFDRYMPFTAIQNVDVTKDGTEIRIEFPGLTIVIKGEGLRSIANAIAGAMGSRLEAFDASKHAPPPTPKPGEEPLPIIRHIEFCIPLGSAAPDGQQAGKGRPTH